MEGARLKWRRTTTAALLGFLPLTLLIPGAFALRCHSYNSIQPLSRDQISTEFSVGPSVFSVCSAGQNICTEAHLILSTETAALFISHRGCASEVLKDHIGSSTSGDRHLTIYTSLSYCRGDLCNGKPVDLSAFKLPEQDKASEASSSNQCYSGFAVDSDQDILDSMTCGRDDSQCYEGNGTITVGHLTVDFLVKTCQDPSCTVPRSQSIGPIELNLWGSCCHGAFCNGPAVAPLLQANDTRAPLQNTTSPSEEDDDTQPTDVPEHNVANSTEDTFAVLEEHTVSPDDEPDIGIGTATVQNPLYDYEEYEDDSQSSGSTNFTLNPRASGLGPPMLSLPFYLLLGALGVVLLGM